MSEQDKLGTIAIAILIVAIGIMCIFGYAYEMAYRKIYKERLESRLESHLDMFLYKFSAEITELREKIEEAGRSHIKKR